MKINVVGINHETASVSQREIMSSLALTPLEVKMGTTVSEVSILATCGRFEIYFIAPSESYKEAHRAIVELLEAPFNGCPPEFYWHTQEFAIAHLMRVACGLDSAVLGEDQILGQVKNAISDASECGAAGKILNKVFRDAVSFAKAIKTELKLSENPLSLSYIAVKKASECGFLKESASVTMVGLGKMGGLAIQYLLDSPVQLIYVSVRHPERLPDWVLVHPKVRIATFEERYACISKSQIVVASTGAPHTVIREESFEKMKGELLLIDLAMPRDIEESLGNHDDVTLWNVDNLKDISDANLQRRYELTQKIVTRLDEQALKTKAWIDGLDVDDIIKKWHESIANITGEAMKSIGRKNIAYTPRETELLQTLFESSLKQMIKAPLESLKKMEDKSQREAYIGMLKELYNYE